MPSTVETESGLDPRTFRRIAEIVYQKAGIVLGEKKEALVAARLGKRMRQLGLTRYSEYLTLLENSPEEGEPIEMLNAISTNVTQFFREPAHFKRMADWLMQWHAAGQTRFRMWCAAASSGEEPYCMAMMVREHLPPELDVRILATDLSTRALAEAKAGLYSGTDISPIPQPLRDRYFKPAQGGVYRVSDELTTLIKFARLNLSHPPFPMQGPFDVIFCRNVMIYFDNDVRRRLLEECHRLLRVDGYLVVGHAESLSGLLGAFKPLEPSIYIKK
ncbi:MAG: protein-glutamate O-methyltransferase [bacterium]